MFNRTTLNPGLEWSFFWVVILFCSSIFSKVVFLWFSEMTITLLLSKRQILLVFLYLNRLLVVNSYSDQLNSYSDHTLRLEDPTPFRTLDWFGRTRDHSRCSSSKDQRTTVPWYESPPDPVQPLPQEVNRSLYCVKSLRHLLR